MHNLHLKSKASHGGLNVSMLCASEEVGGSRSTSELLLQITNLEADALRNSLPIFCSSPSPKMSIRVVKFHTTAQNFSN